MTKKLKTLDKDVISPDGVGVIVNWNELPVSGSVFVPCINTSEAKRQVRSIFVQRGWQVKCTVRVEKGMLGVRFWRTL